MSIQLFRTMVGLLMFGGCNCSDNIDSDKDSIPLFASKIIEATSWERFEVRVTDTEEGRFVLVTELPERPGSSLSYIIHTDGEVELLD